jgi:epoxyqueuosine reductase QueG
MNTHWPRNRPPQDDLADLRKQWHDRYKELDKLAGIETTDDFEPFTQKNDMFTRAFWDDKIHTAKTEAFFAGHRVAIAPRRAEGFRQKDLALRNASWAVSNILSSRGMEKGKREGFQACIEEGGPISPGKVPVEDVGQMTGEIKKLAKLFGADLVGITDYDERWVYKSRVDTRDYSESEHDLPAGLTNTIVMGHSMNHGLVSTYPSALAGASSGLEYSHEAGIVVQLVTYIRNLGYQAVGSMNDTALVIPLAVKAGLGEYGRNQMVITPEYGPRVRFSKIFTDLPLEHDLPKKLGVREFCDICTKCADNCPPKALPFGAPDENGPNVSTIKGVKKWSADCEKCFGYWAAIASDCAICMRVCPYNRKGNGLGDRLFRLLANSRFRKLALWLDNKSDRADRVKPTAWWSHG